MTSEAELREAMEKELRELRKLGEVAKLNVERSEARDNWLLEQGRELKRMREEMAKALGEIDRLNAVLEARSGSSKESADQIRREIAQGKGVEGAEGVA